MQSSIRMTLRLSLQPDDCHGTVQVSGSSPETSGPVAVSRSRMSLRHLSLARTQSIVAGQPRSPSFHSAISARYKATSSLGLIIPSTSISARPASAESSSAGEYDDPRRLQATRSAFGAIAATGSIWSSVSWRTTSSRPAGVLGGRSRSWARTAMRRASRRESSWTVTIRGYADGRFRRPHPLGLGPRGGIGDDGGVAQVLVNDAGADVGHLGPFGEPVDDEGVQMLVVGHGDVKQEILAAGDDEHADGIRQAGRPVAEGLDVAPRGRPDPDGDQRLDRTADGGEIDVEQGA